MKIIRKFLDMLSGGKPDPSSVASQPGPVVVPRDRHTVSRKRIDPDALKVLNRLNRYNHTAYLVGGGVRDLLLERTVKDFDIATSAHPQEIKRLFRNCRLIGRRFRLAHILFRGRKVIEVSTFRRHAGFGDGNGLLIKRDNTFGTAEEDALRRDFTVNGLFYNSADFTVIDYVGGLKDLEKSVIATIGDPDIRFREDPIRILRALRFAARLGFTFSGPTRQAIVKHRKEIWQGATPRILDEIMRMLQQGAAAESIRLMSELQVLPVVLPRLAADFDRKEDVRERILENLKILDGMSKPKEGLPPALLVSALYYPSLDALLRGESPGVDRTRLTVQLLGEDLARLQFPKLQTEKTRLLLTAQHRIENIGRKRLRPSQLVRKAYFNDALTLFEITRPGSRENRSTVRRWRDLQKRIKSDSTGSSHGSPTDSGRKARTRRRRRSGGRPPARDDAPPSARQDSLPETT